MRIAVCDDEAACRERLCSAIHKSGIFPDDTKIVAFSEGSIFLNSHKKKQFDIVFLDIEMPEMSGLEIGQALRFSDNMVILVFITSHRQYVFSSFKVEPFDYIVKPVMWGKEYNEVEKVIKYNHFVKQIELEEQPEIIIVGIPGGSIPFDRNNHNYFGIMTYQISHAIPADYAVMCLPYYPGFKGDYSEFKEDINAKYGLDIGCCHIAAVSIDVSTLMEDYKRRFVTLQGKFVKEKVGSYGMNDVLNLTSNIDFKMAVDQMINKLANFC